MVDFGPIIITAKIAQSKSIDFNNGTITQAKMTLTETGLGNIILSMAADGSTFEIVEDGVIHTFATTGTDLKWKIEGSGKVITNIQIDNYH